MPRRFFIFLAAFLLIFNIGFKQGRALASEPTGEAHPPAQQQAPPKLITAIEVKGNKSISANTIISKMKTRVGAPYQENVISDDLKRLYLLGFFSDIKIDTEDYKGGTKIIVIVSERPLIEKIIFSGIVRITMKDEKLKETLKSKEGQYLDYPNLSEDVKSLKKLYEKIGFSQAAVDYQVDINKDTNKVNVQFNVVEGKRVRIKKIIAEGNLAFSSGRILRLMKTKSAWLFNAGVLKEETLKEDIERVKSFYQRNGFIDAAVDYEVKTDPQKPYFLYVNIKIQEGKKYLVGNITIQGNNELKEKEIVAHLKECIPGLVFSREALKQDINSIQSLYFDRGFIAVQIQEITALNPQTGRIDIVYTIIENQVAYVDKIKVRGNVKTKDIVVRRELRIRPGDRFDGDKLRRSKERLQNLGFFDEISYDTENTAEAAKKDLIVEVKETKTGSFSFGGGYSTVDQFVGFAEIEQKNFDWKNWPYFTGAGQNLKFRGSFGSLSSGYELSFTEPWMFDYPVSFGFDAYQRIHDQDTDVGYGYDEKVTGGDLRLGKEISEFIRADMAYRYELVKIGAVTEDSSEDLKREVGTNKISSLNFGGSFDSRNNVFNTTKGNLLTGSLDWAGGPLGGDKNFWKFFGRASHYFPLWRDSALEIRGRIGLADPYGNTERIPIYERFFAGGTYTVRGYHERKVGPVDPTSKDPLGGDSLLVGNIEYTYPVFDFLKVAAFYDVGNVWEKIGDIGSSKDANGVENTGGFKSGIGFGVRVKTPIGPLMLDYGIPLNKEAGEEKKGSGKFYFSMSQGF